jgi:hypothetical protein
MEAAKEQPYRGKFSDRHAQPVQSWKKDSGHRLMDCALAVWELAECPKTMCPPGEGEFVVLDYVTREAAYFEWPLGADALQIHKMIQGHFGVGALRLFPGVWVV